MRFGSRQRLHLKQPSRQVVLRETRSLLSRGGQNAHVSDLQPILFSAWRELLLLDYWTMRQVWYSRR